VYRSHDTAGGGDGEEEEEEEEEVKGAGRWTKGGRERSEGETSRGEMAGRRKTRHETATEWSSSLTKHQNGTYEAPLLVLTRILFVLVRADGKKEGERERERKRSHAKAHTRAVPRMRSREETHDGVENAECHRYRLFSWHLLT